MTQWAAMVMRKIYVNARRPQSKRNRAEPFDCRSARGWLAAGCSRLDTTSKNAMPGNIRVIVVGSGIGELVRTPEMAYKAKFLPSPTGRKRSNSKKRRQPNRIQNSMCQVARTLAVEPISNQVVPKAARPAILLASPL